MGPALLSNRLLKPSAGGTAASDPIASVSAAIWTHIVSSARHDVCRGPQECEDCV